MHTISKFFTVLIILMVLIPSTIAAPNENANPKAGLKIVDQSNGTMKEIKDDKVKGIKSSSGDIIVDEKGKNSIKLKDSKPSKDAKEHKKVKVSIPASELQKIDDPSKDGVFGVMEIADDGTIIEQYTATTAQLVAGDDFTFSEVKINGFSGYREETFTGVKSGDILNTVDVTGAYTRSASVNGTIPSSVPMDRENISQYPGTPIIAMPMSSAVDLVSGTSKSVTNVTFANGKANLLGSNSIITVGDIEDVTSYYIKLTPTAASRDILTKWTETTSKTIAISYSNPPTKLSVLQSASGTTHVSNYSANNYISDGEYHSIGVIKSGTSTFFYKNGVLTNTFANSPAVLYNQSTANIILGKATINGKFYGTFDDVVLYQAPITAGNVQQLHTGYAGMSFDSNNNLSFVPYNVGTNVEKVISSGGASTSVQYFNTNSQTDTRTIIIKTYYTLDTTKTSQSDDSDFHNISIVHKSGVAITNGTIARLIPPLYTGTAVLDSNNTNAVMTQNRTHFTIYTGALTTADWFGYNVSVPNNADHGMWRDLLMKWVSGVGWDFVGDAPTDYTDDISNEITVTVS